MLAQILIFHQNHQIGRLQLFAKQEGGELQGRARWSHNAGQGPGARKGRCRCRCRVGPGGSSSKGTYCYAREFLEGPPVGI